MYFKICVNQFLGIIQTYALLSSFLFIAFSKSCKNVGKTRKKETSTYIYSLQHPNAGWNIQHQKLGLLNRPVLFNYFNRTQSNDGQVIF